MASYAACCFFLLTLSFSLHIHARDSKFFSNNAPSPAPAPESSDVEHGYGLYGRESVKAADVAGEVKYVQAEGLGKKSFRDFVMPNSNEYGNGWNRNENENEKKRESESEKQGMSDTRFLENGKYYYDGNNEKNGNGNENEKQEMNEYMEGNGISENEGNGNEKQEMSEYREESRFPENEGNGREKQEMEEDRFSENEGGPPGGDKEKQDMEKNRFPENVGNGNEVEKKYLVDGKYYSGYVTKSGNGNEKQEMNEYVEDENSFPENKENGNEYETQEEKTGEKRYFVNGKYYSGYVTGSKNRNGNEKQGMSEHVEDEYSFPQNKESVNRYQESEEPEMGDKRYFVNGKYYTGGYVTKSESGNENENHGTMSEYVEDENRYPENEGREENETEKKYLVNGKYYNGYVTKSGYGDRKNHNYDNYEDSGANGHNENEFYDGDNEYVREGQEQEYGERQNEYAP